MSKPIPSTKILASVELGSPAADCAHFGICSVEVLSPEQWAVFQPRHIRHLKAVLSVTASGGLRFEFPLDGMRTDTRMVFFPPEGFRVDSAMTLPHFITLALNLPLGTTTLTGMYALVLSGNRLRLDLTIEMPKQLVAGGTMEGLMPGGLGVFNILN